LSKVWLIVDSREAAAQPDIIAKLERRFVVEKKFLSSGDYLFSNGVCVERKTGLNFYQDVINGHLFEQL